MDSVVTITRDSDWKLQHRHLQAADKDMPRMPEGVCDAEGGGIEEWEDTGDHR